MRTLTHNPPATVLIFGGNGRLGRLLRKAWARRPPHGVVPLYQARSGPCDFCWPSPASPLPAAEAIIALWGVTSGSDAELAANTSLAHASLEAAHMSGARLVLHFSSAAVYGKAQDACEITPPRPVNAYGRAKLAMEQAIADFPDEGIAHCCLRLANVVGADSLAPALLAGPVRLDRFNDGRGPLRSYIGVGHLARILEALCTLPVDHLPGVLNIASPEPVEMQALAEAAGKRILWQDAPKTALQKVTLDSGRLARLLPDMEALTTAPQMITDWHELEARA